MLPTYSPPEGHTLFDTAIGPCAIAWGVRGIVGVQLPEADAHATRSRLLKSIGPLPEAPPPDAVKNVIEAIRSLLAGARNDAGALPDLRDAVLDESAVPEFHRRVYAIARRIQPGQTRSYGEIATELGDRQLARAVGQALGANPFAPVVPCHRVLAADGRPGGFSAHGGAHTKLRMLAIEGAMPGGTASLFSDF